MEDGHFRTTQEVLEFFGTDRKKGLTAAQVQKNRAKFGPNELPPQPKSSWISLVIKQFQDMLVLILLGAAVISFLLSLLEEDKSYWETMIEPSVILLILICNAVVGVWQESSAEEAIEKLKEFEAKTAVVVRDGEVQKVDRSVLVPGDLVVLSVGEKVPADCRVLEINSRTLQSDQSMLTGESHAINKLLDPIPKPKQKLEIVDQDKRCILFSGTLVVHGKCRAIVTLTGANTSMGKIHKGLMEESEHKTPLGEKLDEFAEFLSKVISGICIVVWLINLNHFSEHGSWIRGAMYYLKIAVALAVAAIPEGLPAVVTTCLALGTRRMAKKNAIVKTLPSVETLGCTTVICSDKTGTLTTNQMSVRKMMTIEHASKNSIDIHHYKVTGTTYNPIGDVLDGQIKDEEDAKLLYPCEKPSLRWISKVSCLCNDATISYDRKDNNTIHWHVTGEPTEGALKVLAEKLHLPDAEEAARLARDRDVSHTYNAVHKYWTSQMTREHVLEFTRDRKSMSVFVRQSSTDKGWLLVKGAPESLLERSSHIFVNHTDMSIPITEIHKNEIDRVYHEFASEGLRCLGIAFKAFDSKKLSIDSIENKKENEEGEDYSAIESNLTFVGVVGMLDPPRPEVKDAIRICKQAGIRVIVITGDNKKTAEEICREIGLFGEHEDLNGKSFTGGDFMVLSEKQQNEAVQHATLFSRVMPQHKQHLVDLLQKHKEVVAMTGDGVNDAPALKKADIGIGMGSGMEVAKHAADMILSDDNFATIVSAVEEGRAIYSNTKQFIRYLISSNIGEVVCIFLTAALGFPEALIPVQLLWVNLVTDGLPATALGFNKPDIDIMTKPPRGRTEKIINGWMFFRYVLIGTYVGAATIFGFYWWFCWYSNGPNVTFQQLTHFYACNQSSATNQLYFSSWKGDCSVFRDFRPCTVSLSILVTIEMFNTFNALSENQSLLVNPPWANIYVVFAVTLSMLLHIMILYVPFFRTMFSTAGLNSDEWIAVLLISFPVVILDETLKFFSRCKEGKEHGTHKKIN